MDKPVVVCIVGPTACRKTEVSVALAQRMNGEIVSADSVAVYRGLDVGSAKPTREERRGVPHHMIDVADPTDTDFTVARFRKEARNAIDGILSRKKLPIVVGGSGLYSDSIFAEMSFSAPSNSEIRAQLEKEYVLDSKSVFERLMRVDSKSASRIHPNDAKRIIRALEVYTVSGKTFSDWNDDFARVQEQGETYRVIRIGLDMERKTLYQRIDLRVDQMFEQGLVEEAYDLFRSGLTPELPALQSIGYAQLYDAYTGKCTLDEAKEQIKLDTRHFAKRQLTWFRRNKQTKWHAIEPDMPLEDIIMELQKEIEQKL